MSNKRNSRPKSRPNKSKRGKRIYASDKGKSRFHLRLSMPDIVHNRQMRNIPSVGPRSILPIGDGDR